MQATVAPRAGVSRRGRGSRPIDAGAVGHTELQGTGVAHLDPFQFRAGIAGLQQQHDDGRSGAQCTPAWIRFVNPLAGPDERAKCESPAKWRTNVPSSGRRSHGSLPQAPVPAADCRTFPAVLAAQHATAVASGVLPESLAVTDEHQPHRPNTPSLVESGSGIMDRAEVRQRDAGSKTRVRPHVLLAGGECAPGFVGPYVASPGAIIFEPQQWLKQFFASRGTVQCRESHAHDSRCSGTLFRPAGLTDSMVCDPCGAVRVVCSIDPAAIHRRYHRLCPPDQCRPETSRTRSCGNSDTYCSGPLGLFAHLCFWP